MRRDRNLQSTTGATWALATFLVLSACEDKVDERRLDEVRRSLATIVATCSEASGEVSVRRGGGEYWAALATAAVLRSGDWLRTGARSSVSLDFVSGGSLVVEEGALVVISADMMHGDRAGQTVLSVRSGTVRAQMARLAGESMIPLVITDADGARIGVAPSEPGEVEVRFTSVAGGTEISVRGGSAVVSSGSGEVLLESGQRIDFERGRVGKAERLLRFPRNLAPSVDARFAWHPGLSIELEWTEVSGAVTYQAQIGRDLSFRVLVESIDQAETRLSFKVPEPGLYTWRTASRDKENRLSEYGFARRIYCEQEAPQEYLRRPADGAEIGFHGAVPPVVFLWLKVSEEARYQLVIASSPDLDRDAVTEIVTTQTWLRMTDLSVGTFYWGVYIADESRAPIFLQPRKLTITRLKEAPVDSKMTGWGD